MGRKISMALIACALLAALGFWGYSLLAPQIKPVADLLEQVPEDVNIDISAKGIELSQGREGKKLWQLKAASAEYDQEQGTARVIEPRVVYYPEGEGEPVEVEAPLGLVNQNDNTIVLETGVTMRQGPVVLKGRRLTYNGGANLITVTGDVSVERQEMRIAAPRMSYNLKSMEIVAESGVEFTMADTPTVLN